MSRKLAVVGIAVVGLLPAIALTVLISLYALWWQRATPVWYQGQLTAVEMQRPTLQTADRVLKGSTGFGLMQLPTLSPGVRYDTLTELWWSNGDVTVVLSVGPPTLLDERGLPYFHPRQVTPPSKLASIASVPGNFTLLALSRQEKGFVVTQLVRWPHGSVVSHRPGVSVAGVVVLAIGKMNDDSVKPDLPEAQPMPLPGPTLPDRDQSADISSLLSI